MPRKAISCALGSTQQPANGKRLSLRAAISVQGRLPMPFDFKGRKNKMIEARQAFIDRANRARDERYAVAVALAQDLNKYCENERLRAQARTEADTVTIQKGTQRLV